MHKLQYQIFKTNPKTLSTTLSVNVFVWVIFAHLANTNCVADVAFAAPLVTNVCILAIGDIVESDDDEATSSNSVWLLHEHKRSRCRMPPPPPPVVSPKFILVCGLNELRPAVDDQLWHLCIRANVCAV